MRYLAYISYDGSDFFGFAISVGQRTIQEEIEKALKILTKKDIKIFASGRTDAKVHAINQAIHFDLDFSIKEDRFVEGINKILSSEVRLNNIIKVNDSFHARYDVKTKEYRYLIKLSKPTVFENRYVGYYKNLDIQKIISVKNQLIGTHDFYAFTPTPITNKPTIKTIYSIEITKNEDIITISFIGNGFLRYMVRQFVGLMVSVASGQKQETIIKEMLLTKNRKLAVKNASPNGLYLYMVNY